MKYVAHLLALVVATGCGSPEETGYFDPSIFVTSTAEIENVDTTITMVGEPGALTPGGIAVRNQRTDISSVTVAQPAGNFDTTIQGRLHDFLEVYEEGMTEPKVVIEVLELMSFPVLNQPVFIHTEPDSKGHREVLVDTWDIISEGRFVLTNFDNGIVTDMLQGSHPYHWKKAIPMVPGDRIGVWYELNGRTTTMKEAIAP